MDGVVLAADKRTTTQDGRGFSDTADKIRVAPDGRSAWATASAVTRLTHGLPDGGVETSFDVDKTIDRQVRGGADPTTSFVEIGDAIRTDFLAALAQSKTGDYVPPGIGPNHILLKSVFFVVRGAEAGIGSVNLLYDGTPDVKTVPFNEPECESRTLCYFGNASVAEQLRYYDQPAKCPSCNDPHFRDLRGDSSLSKFLHEDPPWPTVKTEQAVAVAKRLLAVTNKWTMRAGEDRNDVGPTVDIGILRRDGTFAWIDRDVLADPQGKRATASSASSPGPAPNPNAPWVLVGLCAAGLVGLGVFVWRGRARGSARRR
jgi:hypothetical protein